MQADPRQEDGLPEQDIYGVNHDIDSPSEEWLAGYKAAMTPADPTPRADPERTTIEAWAAFVAEVAGTEVVVYNGATPDASMTLARLVEKARSIIDVEYAAPAAVDEATPVALDEAVEDVRYAGGNGTSDYWRGFNDGIDKLAARLAGERG